MANASVYFVPDIDDGALKRTQNRIVKAFQETSRRVSRDFEKKLEGGVEKGIKRGIKLGRAGLAGLAAAAGAAALVGVSGGTETAQNVIDRANQVNEIRNLADALGIDRGNLAQLASVSAGGGMDISDLRGMLVGFQAAFQDAEFSNFAGVADRQGLDTSFLAFLDIASRRTGSDRSLLLQRALGEEDSVLAGILVNRIESLREQGQELSLQNLFEAATGRDDTAEDLATRMNEASEALLSASQASASRFVDMFDTDFNNAMKDAQSLIAAQYELEQEQIRTIQQRVEADKLIIQGQILASQAVEKTAETVAKVSDTVQKMSLPAAAPGENLSQQQRNAAMQMGNIPGAGNDGPKTYAEWLALERQQQMEMEARAKEMQTKVEK